MTSSGCLRERIDAAIRRAYLVDSPSLIDHIGGLGGVERTTSAIVLSTLIQR